MQRITISPRPELAARLEARGMLYHAGYYPETSAYQFTAREVNRLEAATNELFGLCLQVVQHVIDHELWDEFFIPRQHAELIRRSWREDDVSLYGRFDLGYDSRTGDVKLLEFNADTPTALLEAAVIQHDWLLAAGKPDQWNSLHERLVAHLRACRPYLPADPTHPTGPDLYLACARDSAEDYMTVAYLAECAAQAGYAPRLLYVDEISVDAAHDHRFCTPDGTPIRNLFKLYPWEWLLREEFAPHLLPNYATTTWLEPPYKAILSNKMLLVYLWKLFPGHRLLLESYYYPPGAALSAAGGRWCRKPVFSREGQNTAIVDNGRVQEERPGDYGEEGYVWQRFFPIETFDGWLPVLGSWLVAGEAAGLGIREQHGSLITDNLAHFAPHWFA